MAGRFDRNPFPEEEEVNPFAAGSVPPATKSRLSPLPHEPADFYDRSAPVDIPLDSAADLKKKEKELQAKEPELQKREQNVRRREEAAARGDLEAQNLSTEHTKNPQPGCEMQTIEAEAEANQDDGNNAAAVNEAGPPPPLSKSAQKKLLKQQRFEAKKAEKKAAMKEQKKRQVERKRKEWDEKLAALSEEERSKLIESRKGMRKERMDKRSEEREKKIERLNTAKQHGQNIVIDLEFSHLMSPNEINSLVQQIMYCYAVNGRCPSPAHLWLTGCEGEMGMQLQRLPGYDKWIIDKDTRPYIDTFQDQKEHLVYLTADSETMLDQLDPNKIYIVGGLVDRNRWKGITMKKAEEQMIQTAKLPIGTFLKMSSSQVLTVNQVIEILLKYMETKDWKASFFQVIPQRKRFEAASTSASAADDDSEECQEDIQDGEKYDQDTKRLCIEP